MGEPRVAGVATEVAGVTGAAGATGNDRSDGRRSRVRVAHNLWDTRTLVSVRNNREEMSAAH